MSTPQQYVKDSFYIGKDCTVLDLDLMAMLNDNVHVTGESKEYISNCSRWPKAVHKNYPWPFTIFTSLILHAEKAE